MLGCYGNQQIRTPQLDRLASEGVRFRHCVSCYRLGYAGKWRLLGGNRDRPVPPGPMRYEFGKDYWTNNCHLDFRPGKCFCWIVENTEPEEIGHADADSPEVQGRENGETRGEEHRHPGDQLPARTSASTDRKRPSGPFLLPSSTTKTGNDRAQSYPGILYRRNSAL